jgi:hypothetical protein
VTASYEVKLLKSAHDKEFAAAINAYLASTPAEIRTDTNEIAYWLDRTNTGESASKRRLYFFDLLYNGNVIGYSEIAFLKLRKVVFIDYVALDTIYQKNSFFYIFLNLLMNYFSSNNIDYHYIIAEVSVRNEGRDIDQESAFFKQMVAKEDFLLVNAPYRQPFLGMHNGESNFDCNMLLKPISETHHITKQTYLSIVHDIYYEHYLAWYQPFFSQEEYSEYEGHLQQQFDLIKDKLKETENIEMIKYSAVECAYFTPDKCVYEKSTAGFIQAKKEPSWFRWWHIPIVIVLTVLFSVGMFLALQHFQIKSESLAPLLTTSTAIVVGSIAYVIGRKAK